MNSPCEQFDETSHGVRARLGNVGDPGGHRVEIDVRRDGQE